MSELVAAEGAFLAEIIEATFDIWNEGLNRFAYGRYYAAQLATPWGRAHLHRTALVDASRGSSVLASLKEYRFEAVLDGRPIRVVGIGAVFTQPAHRRRGHARALLERVLERAAGDGCDLALLFSEIDPAYYARLGFVPLETTELQLRVVESDRYGAPAMLVRAGDDRDLADIAAMGAVRAAPFRFHLTRDRDLVHYAIAKRRLLAGLGTAGLREIQFFIVEEGASAVAYVAIVARRGEWTIDSLGDRDPSGARVGAILQTLVAREPAERRPTVKAWLPANFRPPQIAIVSSAKPRDVMMIKPLTLQGTPARPLQASDILYWHGDLF